MMNRSYCIARDVRKSDLPALAMIEQQRWAREETAILTLNDLNKWFETNSSFFIVAEGEDGIVGYYYGMQVHFSIAEIDVFTAPDTLTNRGYTKHTHDPHGLSVFGETVVTTTPHAGVVLNDEIHRRLHRKQIKFFTGYSRLVHLNQYLEKVERENDGVLPYPEATIALWYAQKSMDMLGAKRWEGCLPLPNCTLPPLRRPDTILKFHVEGTNAGLLRVVSNYMPDKKSRNYGAFLMSEFPHI